jgi:hypothetical protein
VRAEATRAPAARDNNLRRCIRNEGWFEWAAGRDASAEA